MLSWFHRRQRIQNSKSRRPRAFRPAVEGLEDRCLLAAPVIDPIGTVNVPSGKSVVVPVAASHDDPGADPSLIYSSPVSSNPQINAQVLSRGTYLQLTVEGFGDMVFQLFPELAPRTVASITGLAKAGFYDGLTFHRILSDFVIQGGDPVGNGSGGPPGAGASDTQRMQFQFNDEFNRNLIFTGTGLLAMAKGNDDTNGSQFFVTINPARNLDFNHTIFGQLIRGQDVLNRIRNVQVVSQGGGNPEVSRPVNPPRISRATVVENLNDAVLLVTAQPGATGQATITLQASDGDETGTRTFLVNAAADPAINNDIPFLDPITDKVIAPGQTQLSFQVLASADLEGDQPIFEARIAPGTPAVATVMVSGNLVTVTPNVGFTGPIQVQIGARDNNPIHTDPNNPPNNPQFIPAFGGDTQIITIGVGGRDITAASAPLSAAEGSVSSNVTVATFSNGDTAAAATAFSATISWGDGNVSTGAISGNNGNFVVTGTNTFRHAGRYPVRVTIRHVAQGNSAVVFGTTTVADAAIMVTGGPPITGTRGQAITNATVATFTDANPNGRATDFTAVINWGDGTTSPGAISAGAGGVRNVVGSHTYAAGGTFTVTATITGVVPADDATVISAATATAGTTATVALPPAPVPLTDEEFVSELYRTLLRREAADSEVGLYVTAFRGGFTREDAVMFVTNSEEHRGLQADDTYRRILGRSPDDRERRNTITDLRVKGVTYQMIEETLLQSDEYFRNRGGNTNAGFLASAYRDLFGRPVDEGARGAFERAFAAAVPISDLVHFLVSSAEAARIRTRDLFQLMLNRAPDTSGTDTFVAAYGAGVPDDEVIAFIAASNEFNQK